MTLRLHFLNVGHGDCTIIEFPSGRLTMVDINAPPLQQSPQPAIPPYLARIAQRPTSGFSNVTHPMPYVRQLCGNAGIFRFIATHPHMDHLSGLARLCRTVPIYNFWSTGSALGKPDFAHSPYQEEDWAAFQMLARGTALTRSLSPKLGEQNHYWTDDGIHVWLPTRETEALALRTNQPNLASYVLAIAHGYSVVVLGGDADELLWEHLFRVCNGRYPRVSVLKASHHGRDTGYHQPSVKAMSPALTVVSVGEKPENDASHLYGQYSGGVLSTVYHGNIVVTVEPDGRVYYQSDRTRAESLAALQAARKRATSAPGTAW